MAMQMGKFKLPQAPKQPGKSLPPITVLEFAELAAAVYAMHSSTVRGFTRHHISKQNVGGHFSGFHGGVFRRQASWGVDHVVALAGTEDGTDVVADLGFGGNVTRQSGRVLGFANDGIQLLATQVSSAVRLADAERRAAGGGRIYVTGHSLGGGLAQIVAAKCGLPAVTFHPAGVGALKDVMASYEATKPRVVNFRFKNDPINHVATLGGLNGSYLGTVIWLNTPRTGPDAHRMGLSVKELSPQGQFADIGASDPFALSYANPEEQRAANLRWH